MPKACASNSTKNTRFDQAEKPAPARRGPAHEISFALTCLHFLRRIRTYPPPRSWIEARCSLIRPP